MDYSDIIAIIALIFSAVSGITSFYTYIRSLKRQKTIDTIEAYRVLQSDVLDKFVSYNKSDILNLLKNMDEPEIKIAYDDCRAMIAKLEHFSVAINDKMYDFDTMDKLGGIHLIYLFTKVEPIIKHTRKQQNEFEKPYYCEFEKMVRKLNNKHSEYKNEQNTK